MVSLYHGASVQMSAWGGVHFPPPFSCTVNERQTDVFYKSTHSPASSCRQVLRLHSFFRRQDRQRLSRIAAVVDAAIAAK